MIRFNEVIILNMLIIDSGTNHKRHFTEKNFINKGLDFIDLLSFFKDRSVTSSMPTYLCDKSGLK